MKTINFTKMNGAGNDFILIDTIKNNDIKLTEPLIRSMCDRRTGIGADGILIIEPSRNYDFNLIYYNSDGSLGSLCGNGSRCSLKYISQNYKVNNSKINFTCKDIKYSGSIEKNNLVKFHLNPPEKIKVNLPIMLSGEKINGHFADSGSPHAVIFWEEIMNHSDEDFFSFNMNEFGKKIRFAEEFKPEGTNVNLIKIDKDKIFIRTYERGVEEETFACGTGSVASAIILNIIKQIQSPVSLITLSGEKLIISFRKQSENFNKITLTGPAKINYIGSYNF